MRTCTVCAHEKDESEFSVYNKETGARRSQCKECRRAQNKEWSNNNKEKVRLSKKLWARENRHKVYQYQKHYLKTKRGFVGGTYTNMDGRVKGRNKPWIYKGLDICSRAEFIEWSTKDRMFNMLFDEWERSGYEMKLTPSIDRINSNKGYTFDNMSWITHSENSQRGAFSRWGWE